MEHNKYDKGTRITGYVVFAVVMLACIVGSMFDPQGRPFYALLAGWTMGALIRG